MCNNHINIYADGFFLMFEKNCFFYLTNSYSILITTWRYSLYLEFKIYCKSYIIVHTEFTFFDAMFIINVENSNLSTNFSTLKINFTEKC